MTAFVPAYFLRGGLRPAGHALTHLGRRVRLGSMDAKVPGQCIGRAPQSSAAAMSITPDSKCVGCEGIGEAMSDAELDAHLPLIPDWTLNETRTELQRAFRTKNFATALDFLSRAGAIAEAEGHHPDMGIKSWNEVHLAMSTHSLGGITTNDIIMAVKLESIPVQKRPLKKTKPAASS